MISSYNTMGKISLTNEYFAGLVSAAVVNCYGVADMSVCDTVDAVKNMVMGSASADRGVRVEEEDGKLVIKIHIKVTYGLNITAVVRSITHKVKYVVEDATGLTVKRINVSVDDIVA